MNMGKVAPIANKKITVKVIIPLEKNISMYFAFRMG